MEIIEAWLIPECRGLIGGVMVFVGGSFEVIVADIYGGETDGTVSRVENCVVF